MVMLREAFNITFLSYSICERCRNQKNIGLAARKNPVDINRKDQALLNPFVVTSLHYAL